jgi:drug/metabolite transporter (DMT)-like permease
MQRVTAIRQIDTHHIASIILLLSVTSFGFTAIFARLADAPGFVVAAWRVSIASPLLTIAYLRQPAPKRRLDRHTLTWGIFGGLVFVLSVVGFHIALDTTTAANATFLGNIAPMWVGLITLFMLHRKLPHLFWPGVIVALAGAGLIIFGNTGIEEISKGDIIALTNSFLWAGYQVITQVVRERVSALTWVWFVVTMSAFIIIPAALLMGYPLTGYSTGSMLAMLASGILSQGAGFLGYSYALGHITASRASVVNMLQPVITAIAAFVLLAEPFGGWRLIGGGLVLAGIYLVNRPGQQH